MSDTPRQFPIAPLQDPKCRCERFFTCTRCGRHVSCDHKVNLHKQRICRNCCARAGINAILAEQIVDITRAPAELGLATAPRIGTAERAAAEDALNDAWADGRISDELHAARTEAAARAVTQRDLALLTADLAPARTAEPVITGRRSRTLALATSIPPFWLVFLLLMIVILTSGLTSGH